MSGPPPSETIEVLASHRFDVTALVQYLEGRVPGFRGLLAVRQFRGDQSNPIYWLATPDAEYVMRRKPPGKLLLSRPERARPGRADPPARRGRLGDGRSLRPRGRLAGREPLTAAWGRPRHGAPCRRRSARFYVYFRSSSRPIWRR